MKKSTLKKLSLLTVLLLLFTLLAACGSAGQTGAGLQNETGPAAELPDQNGSYTSAEDVSAYLIAYGQLPQNFITKKEARDLGWEGGSLESYAPGKCIGGDRFGNYEGTLPEKDGRTYYECDINTLGADSRGAERLVFSSDGLIYYTADHYESFTLLYGEE
ncbi:MAG: ribonuclease domain-containing protein [Firmicutes bacterium]|nr:ribonuclease domain-containing protein [Bacillota bacterium]MDY5855802.1 ribonuclease domain-containing protein [Anaerovoracaceae bacterium]